MQNGAGTVANTRAIPQKIKHRITTIYSDSTSGNIHKEFKADKRYCPRMFMW